MLEHLKHKLNCRKFLTLLLEFIWNLFHKKVYGGSRISNQVVKRKFENIIELVSDYNVSNWEKITISLRSVFPKVCTYVQRSVHIHNFTMHRKLS